MAEMTVEAREVRRLLLRDPYGMLPIPGLELEREIGNRVSLRVQYRGWSSDPVAVDRATWDALARLEASVFAPPVSTPNAGLATPTQQLPSEPPPRVCHGWSVTIAASYSRAAAWSSCGGKQTAAYDYAVRFINLALSTKPGCTRDGADIFWSFSNCFSPTPRLDDAELEAKVAVLRKEYDEAPGADRLAEARRALSAPGLAVGNQAWLDARTAVDRFKKVQELRQERLRQLQQLAFGQSNFSPADRAKVQQTIEHWSQTLRSQESNYSELLQRLAWAGA
jgi:hypothetical protein